MSTTTQKTNLGREEMAAASIVRGGLVAGAIVGCLAVVLTIIGLANIMPQQMLYLSIIALGAGFLFEGGVIAARLPELLTEKNKERREVVRLGAGLTVEVVGGVAGAIIGILALLSILPMVLTPIAVIVFGVTLIFGSGVASWLDSLLMARSGEYETFGKVSHEVVMASAGVDFFAGVCAVILGILSLVGISPIVMDLTALLCIGFAVLVSGTAISARMWSTIYHTT